MASLLTSSLVPFMGKLQLLNGYFVVAGIRTWSIELARPRIGKIPFGDRVSLLVVHSDRAVLACICDLPLLHQLAPFPRFHGVSDSPLEGHVVPLHATRNLLNDVFSLLAARLVLYYLVF